MAQQQQNIAIQAPGFQGINTEDSPLMQEPGFASVADNCIIDAFGRVGCREAFASYTTIDNLPYDVAAQATSETKQVTQLGGGAIDDAWYTLAIVSHIQYSAVGVVEAEDNYIALVDGPTLTDLPYPTLVDDRKLNGAKILPFNNGIYIFSEGNPALYYDGTTVELLFNGTVDVDYIAPIDDTGTIATEIDGEIATAAYGRLWVAGVNGDYNTVYYSDLLIADQWYDGRGVPVDSQNTGGIIDVSQYWPNGADRITGIVAHNGLLVIFGRHSILLYGSANSFADPADVGGLVLQDTVVNLGLVNRDAVVATGAELMYVDDSGVRSLGRTIQEKSVPLGNMTQNVKGQLQAVIATENEEDISLFFMPDKNLVVCQLAGSRQAYVMNILQPSINGSYKITRWTDTEFNRGFYVEEGGESYTLLAGIDAGGVLEYRSFVEYTLEPYLMKYASNIFTFGDSLIQKFVKQVDFTIISTQVDAPAVVRWGYTGTLDYWANKTIIAQTPALFGVDSYTHATFSPSLNTLKRYRTNTKGSGSLVRVGFEGNINGNSMSIQEINVQTLLGRIY